MARGPALVAVTLAVALGGCADDAAPTRARDGRVQLALDDFLIRPQRVDARAGRITLRATNDGAVGHTLRVMRGDEELLGVDTLLPGASGEATGRLAKGRYELVCVRGNHEELGMYGTLTVR